MSADRGDGADHDGANRGESAGTTNSDEVNDNRVGGMSRRAFVALATAIPAVAIAVGAPALVRLTRKTDRVIAGGYVGDDSSAGHELRDGKQFARAKEQRRVSVAIVGGGMGGLSAGWRLDALKMRDWIVLELGEQAGGNSRSGANDVSRYPWGAHYLPVPGKHAEFVRQLCREMGVLGDDGKWDERTLCHSPQERLWQHGQWHEGLEPFDGLTKSDRDEFVKLEALIQEFRASGGFRIPMAGAVATSQAERVRALDSMTANDWLNSEGLKSKALRWWVEYGTRDDYGASLSQASAWAAVHYFAAREPDELGPLTWPEGNGFIAHHLIRGAGDRVITNAPAYRVERRSNNKWLIQTPRLDVEADALIWAAPLFVLPRVMQDIKVPITLEYAPWVVANITLDRWPAERGATPAWDNVIYDSPSLGYVVATHQNLGESGPRTVWTWYHAMVDRPSRDARIWLRDRQWSAWRDQIIADLSRAHPDIAECVSRIDVIRWGHAMARPIPGVMARANAVAAWKPADRMFLAHADLSGFSVFEEAQWHGVEAAEASARIINGR